MREFVDDRQYFCDHVPPSQFHRLSVSTGASKQKVAQSGRTTAPVTECISDRGPELPFRFCRGIWSAVLTIGAMVSSFWEKVLTFPASASAFWEKALTFSALASAFREKVLTFPASASAFWEMVSAFRALASSFCAAALAIPALVSSFWEKGFVFWALALVLGLRLGPARP